MNVLKRVSLLIFLLLTALLSGSLTAPEPSDAQDDETLVIAYPEFAAPVTEVLVEISERYSEDTGVSVELVVVPMGEIEDFITTGVMAGEPVDIAFLPHDVGAHLATEEIVGAYCLEDGCEQCREPDPPDWCLAAMGVESEHFIEGLSMSGYCLPDGCQACSQPNPPLWCRFALTDLTALGIDIDVIHAATSIFVDEAVFPYGVPVWWDIEAVLVNRAWFEERAINTPTTLEELRQLIEGYHESIVICPVCGGVVIDGMDPEIVESMMIDTVPLPEDTAMAIVRRYDLVEFPELFEDLEIDTTPLIIEGYRPAIFVTGAYALPGENQGLALDFLYELGEEDFQLMIYEETGLLPASGPALEVAMEDSSISNLVESGQTGYLYSAEPMEN